MASSLLKLKDFKVIGSNIHCRSDNISETVLDRYVVTTGH